MSNNACGTHTEVTNNNAVRVTRCTCGTLHVTLNANGVTVRMQPDTFRSFAAGLQGAVEKLAAPGDTSATGSTSIN
jgi:hypothetical protein